MKYYLGIDGGGTKTVAAVADENGNVLTKITGKTINFYSVGIENAKINLKNILFEAEKIGVKQFEGAFIGCSSLDNEADDELTAKLCGGIVNAKKIKMNSDTYIALKSVNDAECPCVAISGTGSMAVAQDKDCNIYIAGGWGHILGDEGSGYSVAMRALKHCCKLSDKGETSAILSAATEFFGVSDFRQVIDIIYSQKTTKDVIAGFASKVCELATDGDEDSSEIINIEACLFADTVLVLLDKIGECDVLALYGGMFRHNEVFVKVFSDKIKKYYQYLPVKILDVPPEEGAVMLARNL